MPDARPLLARREALAHRYKATRSHKALRDLQLATAECLRRER